MGIKTRRQKAVFFISVFILIAAVAFIYIRARLNSEPTYRQSFLSMDTVVDIKIYETDSKRASKVASEVEELFSLLDSLWNPFSPDSEISHVHNIFSIYPRMHKDSLTGEITRVDTTVLVNPHTARILKTSVNFSNEVSKKFNVAIGPLIDLWREYGKRRELPNESKIRSIQNSGIIDVKNIVVDTLLNTVSLKQRGMRLDFGAIAKGYALYKAVDIFENRGIKNFILNAGGDLYATSERKRYFRIGIKNPFETSGFLETVEVNGQAVATSGGYARFFIIDSVLYTHIIDPVLGYPIREQYSVTVILDNPVYADIWATLLSIDRSDFILEKFPENGRYFIALSDTIIKNF